MSSVRRVVIVLVAGVLLGFPVVAVATVLRPVVSFPSVLGASVTAASADGGQVLVQRGDLSGDTGSVPDARFDLELAGPGRAPRFLARGYLEASAVSPGGVYVAWGDRGCSGPADETATVTVQATAAGASPRTMAFPAGYRHDDVHAIVVTDGGRVTVLAAALSDDCAVGSRDAILTAAPGSHRLRVVDRTAAGDGHDDEYGISPNGLTFAMCTTLPLRRTSTARLVAVTAGPGYRVSRAGIRVGFDATLSCASSDAGSATLFDAAASGRVRVLTVGLGRARTVLSRLDADQYPVGFALSPSGRQAVLDEQRTALIYDILSGRYRRLALPATYRGQFFGGISGGLSPMSWVSARTVVSVPDGRGLDTSDVLVLNPVSGRWSRLLRGPIGHVVVCAGADGRLLSAIPQGTAYPRYSRLYLTAPGTTAFTPIRSAVHAVSVVSCPSGTGSVYATIQEPPVLNATPATILSVPLTAVDGSEWTAPGAPGG